MSATDLTDRFRAEVADLRSTAEDAATAFNGAHLTLASYQSVVELVHLQLIGRFEAFVEDLFFACALGESGLPDGAPVVALGSREHVELMVYSDGRRREKYLTWLPFTDTIARAESYLQGGEPFVRLKYRPTELSQLAAATTVRNAIAHNSPHSAAELSKLAQSRSYPCARPADYLLSLRGGASEGQLFLAQLQLIADAITATDAATADSMLDPERTFSADARSSPPGDYECTICGGRRTGHTGGKLGACETCGKGDRCPECGKTSAPPEWRRVF